MRWVSGLGRGAIRIFKQTRMFFCILGISVKWHSLYLLASSSDMVLLPYVVIPYFQTSPCLALYYISPASSS